MTTKTIELTQGPATYFITDEVLIRSEQDALNLMGESEAQTFILHDYNFEPDFFDLSTRKLGDILQKFTNYRIRLAIIGDFSKYPSKILPNFIAESNRQKQYLFVSSLGDLLKLWG